MNEYSVRLTIGHNVRGVPIHDTPHVCNVASHVLGFVGATVTEARGYWQGEWETSTVIDVCDVTLDEVTEYRAKVPALCEALQQEAIMFAVSYGSVEFIGNAATNNVA